MANSQSFLQELCELLDVPQPDPTVADRNVDTFEKAVNNNRNNTSDGRIDLYRGGSFMLESKPGSERLTEAVLDRLAHRCHVVKADGPDRPLLLWSLLNGMFRLQLERLSADEEVAIARTEHMLSADLDATNPWIVPVKHDGRPLI